MSWGTDFKLNVFLSHQIYQNKLDVEDKIKELEDDVNVATASLKMYISSSPKDIVPNEMIDDENGRIDWLIEQTSYYFDTIRENTIQIYQLGLYLQYLEECESINNMKSDCCDDHIQLVDHYRCTSCGEECNKSDYLNR